MLCMINKLMYASYSTVVQYIRDYGCLNFLPEISSQNQVNVYFDTDWMWLVIAKSQKVSSLILNLSNKSL